MEYSVEELAAAAGVRSTRCASTRRRGCCRRRAGRGGERCTRAAHLRGAQAHQALPGRGAAAGGDQAAAGQRRRSSKAAALLAAVADESGEPTLTPRRAGRAQSGVPEPLLASLEAAGLLVPVRDGGEPRYGEADLRMARAGLEVLGAGLPAARAAAAGAAPRRATSSRSPTRRSALFDRYVRKVDGGGADAGAGRRHLPPLAAGGHHAGRAALPAHACCSAPSSDCASAHRCRAAAASKARAGASDRPPGGAAGDDPAGAGTTRRRWSRRCSTASRRATTA